jgi:biotin carboxyl carrier protein
VKLKITVHGVAYEVDVEVLDAGEGFVLPSNRAAAAGPVSAPPAAAAAAPQAAPRPAGPAAAAAPKPNGGASGNGVTCPIAGSVVEVRCKPGAAVQPDEILLVIEAMKMNTSIAAPVAGTIAAVHVGVGDPVREGQMLVEFE